MINKAMLKQLGWSDELIDAAVRVSESIDTTPLGSHVGSNLDFAEFLASPRGAVTLDVAGLPPVGSTSLKL